jgi:hypothetical protein
VLWGEEDLLIPAEIAYKFPNEKPHYIYFAGSIKPSFKPPSPVPTALIGLTQETGTMAFLP